MAEIVAFKDEVMLAGWKESHNAGATVTFWLADPSQLEAFRTMTVRKGGTAGQRLMMVLVQIGDDEKPIAVSPLIPVGPLCRLAVAWCQDPQFHAWACEHFSSAFANKTIRDEEGCKRAILEECNIQSRKELDTSAEAAEKFHRIFREPYHEYLMELADQKWMAK